MVRREARRRQEDGNLVAFARMTHEKRGIRAAAVCSTAEFASLQSTGPKLELRIPAPCCRTAAEKVSA